MHRVESQKSLRRESSLMLTKRSEGRSCDTYLTTGKLTLNLDSESTIFLMNRPKGSVQKEIVTYMFSSMLDSIVESWETVNQVKKENSHINKEIGKVASSILPPKRKRSIGKSSRSRRSKVELFDEAQNESIPLTWWSAPNERAIIRFRNGNTYEGNISMKVMNGEGCFRWADGTTYTGHFKDNEIKGRGFIQWKDDTWYEGEFAKNLRHGQGLFVDSRNQRSYIGQWCSGTKHGCGVIYYSRTFKNSYDGQWLYNVRHGFGSREYCSLSGYEGGWDYYVRDGKGLMIWSNHDFYRGEWKNGVMSGYGTYIWDARRNNSLSHPTIIVYRGQWLEGKRHGCGMLNFGLGFGAYYSGEFKNNQKHGAGTLVSNNGLILQKKQLFQDDNLSALNPEDFDETSKEWKYEQVSESYIFDICDNSVGLRYHVNQAIKQLDKQQQVRNTIIDEFIQCNKTLFGNTTPSTYKENCNDRISNDMIHFELSSLKKSLQCYEGNLKKIYYKYSTILNTKMITFRPVLIRLYLWQMYYDCNVHQKGLTLVEIDNLFSQNPKVLARSPHDPFEPIFFWQFLHSLISVANRLYTKKQLPGPKPDTILARAFRTFMDKDILPGIQQQRGRLVNGFGEFIPLKSLYKLYASLGEPHTLLTYLRAVRRPPHHTEYPDHAFVQTSDTVTLEGRNVFVFSDELTYILGLPKTFFLTLETFIKKKSLLLPPLDGVITVLFRRLKDRNLNNLKESKRGGTCDKLKLFKFGNITSKTLISMFSEIFPQVSEHFKILNLDIEITFLEFFEIFMACADKSVHIKDLQDSLDRLNLIAPPQSPTGF